MPMEASDSTIDFDRLVAVAKKVKIVSYSFIYFKLMEA